ncbi:MAG: SPFH domain-containing protein [Bacteroidetes bacterium]|nr:MAG: SPFH domain-containing protein [Bacteroidota bacterium]
MEKTIHAKSGWLMLGLAVILLGLSIFLFWQGAITHSKVMLFSGGVSALVMLVISAGFMAIEPNNSQVLVLFGEYVGTVKDSGFYWANPFFTKKNITLRANNMDTEPIKVNDKHGNPIMIGAVLVWRVKDTFKANFGVDNYHSFVETQSEAAIRKLAGTFAYDNFEHETDEITLRSNSTEVSDLLELEVSERLAIAGIEVIETRLSHLAYSTEIAGAMLQRQQATAIIAARSKIVEGAVGMVEMALEALSKNGVVHLDEDRKAAMVSNLMVVLCSERAASPVLNTGSLY